MTRLGKAHVEALLAAYDADPIAALSAALRRVLDAPTLDWDELVGLADVPEQRGLALLRGESAALDELAAELNELRGVATRQPVAPARPVDQNRPR